MYKNTISKLLIFIVLIANMALASAANNALKFSHGKYVSLDAIEMGESLTFSSWVKFERATRWSRIFDFGDGRNSNINALMAGLEGDSGKLVFYSFDKNGNYTKVSDGNNAKSFGKVPVDGSWIHVVATINDSGKARLYANGALIGSQDNAYIAPISTRKYGYIANSAWDDNFSDIQIDDFGIWKKALSAKEVESLYLNGISGISSPDYYWNFDQVDTTTLIPVKGNIKGELINIVESDWTVSVIPNKEERKALAIIISKGLSIENVAAIIGDKTGAQRTAAIKALASRISIGLSVENVAALLGEQTGAQRTAAIKALADHGNLRQDGYKATQVNTILADSVNNDRYDALKYLLGHNKAEKNYIQTPISAADAELLMQNMTYRNYMIGLMTDNDIIIDHLNYSDANKIIGKLDGNYRVNAFKDLSGDNKLKKNYLVETLTIIKGVPFPQGPISFADEVIEYKPGKGAEPPYTSSMASVGTPDYLNDDCKPLCQDVSLGAQGVIILKFVDNYLTTSGDDSLDLWVFEVGSNVEATKVDVSVNGVDWIDVGSVAGATSGVNIDAFKDNGIVEDVKYRYIRLTDIRGAGKPPYQGADIDAVGAISAATKEIRDLVKTIEENNFIDFDVAFEGNHWRLQDVVKPELDKLGEVLSAHAFSKGSFELVGHVAGKGGMHKVCIDSKHKVVNNSRFAMECWDTDNAWAQTLSERRAQSVRDYLLKNFTIPAGRIKAYGVGHSQHKFNNPDDAGNRRVEVKYIKQ